MARLAGKIALITGAGAGIGREAAILFAAEGASVVVAELDGTAGGETVRLIEAAGGRACFVAMDVTEPESVESGVRQAVETFGALHILYNNAGGSTMHDGPVTEVPLDEFWRAIRLDLLGTWLVCRYGIPELIKAGGGSVINASSVVALIGWGGKDAYTAAKGGVTALTRSMAVEYAPYKVRVNAVAPCVTRTPRVMEQLAANATTQKFAEQHLLGLAEPRDVAQAALFLASDEAARTTGHIIRVDSGLTIS
ncbi:NAD(P)-dependent dehydrogenase (short-subunit alcohol dehydrogenase family) [Pseudochelatococcus lubricantis]|uniref:NAD(P)-dependent dehydrogenase (Short-subunit alcohol dehydrogenase family) n=1 Tax=Pseudochelatococcus lubricantis TaxID=1538102 RepID=A0ABX0V472_9HYPH|nr:SDR family oxidoreductase [Pseudochelatococcus lubricantis]NIJ59040.1 NAD(P)-dependent dehydrogenase (short-subunit alcohol dehydrogenase family) [Pseudochelatococcus lubricantis]